MHAEEDLEAGFSLLETVIAMVIAGILALAVAGVLVNAMRLSTANADRTVAANIAAGEIEALRAQRAIDLTDGRSTKNATGADGTVYSVTTETALLQSSSDDSVCSASGNGRIAFKRLRVIVDWANRGTTQPVQIDTTKALGVGAGGLDARRGVIAIAVKGGSNQAVAGIPVNLNPSGLTVTTGADGCAVFPNLVTTSSYTASMSVPGYVGTAATQTVTTNPIGVFANQVTRLTVRYDRGGSIRLAADAPAGSAVPNNLTATVKYNSWPTKQLSACTGSNTPCLAGGVVSGLFPDSASTYSMWAGTCDLAAPVSPATADADFVDVDAVKDLDVPLGAAVVKVKNGADVVQPGATLYVRPAPANNGGCLGAESQYTFVTAATGVAVVALPPGPWQLSTRPDFSSPSAVTITARQTTAETVVRR